MQFGFIIFLSIELLRGIVVFHSLRVQIHKILNIVRGGKVEALLDLHFELEHATREIHRQILLFQMKDLRLLFLL